MNELKVNVLGQGDNRLELAKLKDILARAIVIPDYQRPYAWNKENMEELFETIQSNYEDNKKISFLGSVIFCTPDQQTQGQEQYFIIDGQQRLTSLLIVLKYISNKTIEPELINDLESEFKSADMDKKVSVKTCLNNLTRTNEKLIDCINKSQIKRSNDDTDCKDENYIIEYVRNNKLDHDSVINIVNGIEESLERIGLEYNSDQPNTCKKADFYCDIAEYILDKVQFCWLSIAGKEAENFAIDMFNTMNSTGEPLTGFEIFKSRVYQLDKSNNKNKHGEIDKIQKDISSFFNSDRKKIVNHTGKFILFLSLYRSKGYKDKGDISDRNFKKQKNCIEHMLDNKSNVASICLDSKKIYKFYFEVWLKKNKEHQHRYTNESGFCFSFLSDISHDRVLPILLHFCNNQEIIDSAIKTCTAFSVLWRAFNWGGTAGIDQIYIQIAKDLTEEEPTIEFLQNKLIDKLKDKVAGKQIWTDRMKDVAIYNNKKLSRFLIIVASNMLTYEEGVLKPTRGLNMLKANVWSGEDENYKTIEHIVPQKEQTTTPTLKSVHVLGNLTLLPSKFNSSLQNSTFPIKKEEFKKSCNDNTTVDTLPYLPILKELLDINDFNQENVDKRTENLGSIVWDKLAVEWLGFDKE